MNSRIPTVTSFELIANARPMSTACRGNANCDTSFIALALPCSKLPVGKTIISGHVGNRDHRTGGAAARYPTGRQGRAMKMRREDHHEDRRSQRRRRQTPMLERAVPMSSGQFGEKLRTLGVRLLRLKASARMMAMY